MDVNAVNQFLEEIEESIVSGNFKKLTLGKLRGELSEAEHVYVRLVQLNDGQRLSLVHRYPTNDVTKNYPVPDALRLIRSWLNEACLAASLFTANQRFQLLFNRRGKPRLHRSAERLSDDQRSLPPLDHDRSKKRLLQDERFLEPLGILDAQGKPRAQAGDKYRQVHQFVENVAPLVQTLPAGFRVRIVDMGCGKGYLTFALHRYLQERGLDVQTIGIERRATLTDDANAIAQDLQYTGIEFRPGEISSAPLTEVDLLVALHACDTATDEAIFRGIQAGCRWIVVSPCCQHELRPQLQSPSGMEPLFRYGIQLDRMTEAVTDALRCLYLEAYGYTTRLQEFVDPEHTARNLLMIATKSARSSDRQELLQRTKRFQEQFGIKKQRLAELLEAASVFDSA
ncbi:MAG TPA: SAM-dependent methyltransferase [Chthoniobacterales bacterium]|nr:SAM-dependent methyltransferase [Chthoniobacterales bacterium]